MTIAARSSGRVVRSVPLGALPTGVRTAETMTASFMVSMAPRWTARVPAASGYAVKSLQQLVQRVADLAGLPVERVVGALDDDQFARFGQARVVLPHDLQRADRRRLRRARGTSASRWRPRPSRSRSAPNGARDADERRPRGIGRAGRHRDPGAERVPGRPDRQRRVARVPSRRGPRAKSFTSPAPR